MIPIMQLWFACFIQGCKDMQQYAASYLYDWNCRSDELGHKVKLFGLCNLYQQWYHQGRREAARVPACGIEGIHRRRKIRRPFPFSLGSPLPPMQ